MGASPFTDEEVTELRRLLDIEKIRKLMQLYSHHIDAKDIDAAIDLFAEDAVGEWGSFGAGRGHAEIRAIIDQSPERPIYQLMHCTTNFWIELTGPDSAMGRSYLINMDGPEYGGLKFLALYDYDFRRTAAGWKFSRARLNIMWPDQALEAGFPRPMPVSAL
jgi:hypothetical protein